MNQPPLTYEQLTERFVAWAEDRADIRAAIVVGSRARVDHPVDEWSDLDMLIFATNPEYYLLRTDWLENIGNIWITIIGRTEGGDPERLVLFEGGFQVDFVILSNDILPRLVHAESVPDVIRRGTRVLLDKDGLVAQMIPSSLEPPSLHPPTQDEFIQVINSFWFIAVCTAKQLRRGELWMIKLLHDAKMKGLLLRMMEWHARAINGWNYDTWHMGRFLREWADPRALEDLRGTFAHFDEDDSWSALLATMDLFRWLAIETSEKLSYQYPALSDERATGLVRKFFSSRNLNSL